MVSVFSFTRGRWSAGLALKQNDFAEGRGARMVVVRIFRRGKIMHVERLP